jgi:hypothetical protein
LVLFGQSGFFGVMGVPSCLYWSFLRGHTVSPEQATQCPWSIGRVYGGEDFPHRELAAMGPSLAVSPAEVPRSVLIWAEYSLGCPWLHWQHWAVAWCFRPVETKQVSVPGTHCTVPPLPSATRPTCLSVVQGNLRPSGKRGH